MDCVFTYFFFANFRKESIIKFYSSLSNFGIHNVTLSHIGTHSSTLQYYMVSINTSVLYGQYIPQGTKLGLLLFTVMVNEILSTWVLRDQFVNDVNA